MDLGHKPNFLNNLYSESDQHIHIFILIQVTNLSCSVPKIPIFNSSKFLYFHHLQQENAQAKNGRVVRSAEGQRKDGSSACVIQ